MDGGLDIAHVDGETVFHGEVVGFEQFTQASGEPLIIVRAHDRLHAPQPGKADA